MPVRSGKSEVRSAGQTLPDPGSSPTAIRDWPGWLAGLALLGLASALLAWRTVNHDVAWYVYGAGRLLEGAGLYRDVVDLNPPLIFYLSLLPASLGRTGIGDLAAVKVCVAVLLVASLLTAWLVQRRIGAADGPVLPLMLAYVGGLLIGDLFGQREHLAWLLLGPYLLAAGGALNAAPLPRTAGAALGVLAGLGIALKPHFLLIWLAAEVPVLLARGTWRASLRWENAGVAGVLLLYALSVPILTPDYLRLVVPLAREVYGAFDASPRYLATHPALLPTLLAAGLWLALRGRLSRAQAGLPLIFVAASVAGLAAALLQRKGWDYHFYPAQAAAFIAIALLAARAWPGAHGSAQGGSRPEPAPDFPPAWAGSAGVCGVVVLVLSLAAVFEVVRAADSRPLPRQLQTGLGTDLVGQPFAVLSTSVYPAFPLVNLSAARWALRYNCLWPLPGWHPRGYPASAAPTDAQQTRSPREQAFMDAVIDDLIRAAPRVVLIDGGSHFMFGGARFDYVGYFSQEPRFAEWFRQYQRTSPPGQQLQVYRLRPPGSAAAHARPRDAA